MRQILLLIAAGALTACATVDESTSGSTPADKLRNADTDPDLHGDLQITVSRTR